MKFLVLMLFALVLSCSQIRPNAPEPADTASRSLNQTHSYCAAGTVTYEKPCSYWNSSRQAYFTVTYDPDSAPNAYIMYPTCDTVCTGAINPLTGQCVTTTVPHKRTANTQDYDSNGDPHLHRLFCGTEESHQTGDYLTVGPGSG